MRIFWSLFVMITLASCDSPPMVTAVTGSFGADLNAFRASNGAGPVASDAQLRTAAQAHAQDMASRDYFSHDSPGGPNGDTMSERIAATGYRACAAAENIAKGQRDEAAVFVAWRDSPGHRRNMLNDTYADYGLGHAGDVWVLVLAKRC